MVLSAIPLGCPILPQYLLFPVYEMRAFSSRLLLVVLVLRGGRGSLLLFLLSFFNRLHVLLLPVVLD